MIDFRAGILAVVICLVIALINDAPKPVKDNQTPYCVVDVYQGAKDRLGNWHFGWGPMYRPC